MNYLSEAEFLTKLRLIQEENSTSRQIINYTRKKCSRRNNVDKFKINTYQQTKFHVQIPFHREFELTRNYCLIYKNEHETLLLSEVGLVSRVYFNKC